MDTIQNENMENEDDRHKRQAAVLTWANDTFGQETASHTGERVRRFAEEAVELAQTVGLDKQGMLDIVDHVYAKPPGPLQREIGQVGVALLGLAEHLGLSAESEERKEFARVQSLSADYWQARQNAKAEKGLGLLSTAQTPDD